VQRIIVSGTGQDMVSILHIVGDAKAFILAI
jgi:hypothetical protein